jgi:hypothetical protein
VTGTGYGARAAADRDTIDGPPPIARKLALIGDASALALADHLRRMTREMADT